VSVVSLSIRWALIERPNGLAFSCRKRAGESLQNPTISREAVSCNAVLGLTSEWRWCFAASGRGIRTIGIMQQRQSFSGHQNHNL
jgi:hypothetical protein